MDRCSRNIHPKDLESLKDNLSESYFHDGHGRADLFSFFRWILQTADFTHFKIGLTCFERHGDQEIIDGFVDRKDFPHPARYSANRQETRCPVEIEC